MVGGKLRWDLAPWKGFEGIVEAMTYGVKTHGGERDWLKGYAYSSRFASALRHMVEWWNRNDLDESGLSHLKHAAAQLSMLVEYIERNMTHLDDRPPATSTTGSPKMASQNSNGDGPNLPPVIPVIPRRCAHMGFRYYNYRKDGTKAGPFCDDCRDLVQPGVP